SPARDTSRSAGMKRLLTAAVGIPILFVAIKKGPIWVCFALVALAAALATREACALLARPGRRPLTAMAMAGSVIVSVPFLIGQRAPIPPAILFTVPLLGVLGGGLLDAFVSRRYPQGLVGTSLET